MHSNPVGGLRASGRRLFASLATAALLLSPLCAQTAIVITNAGFESPTPTTFTDYTIGATGWTQTNATNAGTFKPGVSGTSPAPIDGVQVGYALGFGGLQQVLTNTYVAGQTYTYSVYIGFRSDEQNSLQGTGAISLGIFSAGTFTSFSTTSATVNKGQFSYVTGSFQTPFSADGQAIALQLTSTTSYQSVFDHVELSYSAVPEPSTYAALMGVSALGVGFWRRRQRSVGAG